MISSYKLDSHTVARSSKEKSWRLVHDGKTVLDLFESEGFTETINTLFTGTETECRNEIARLGLVLTPEVVE